MSFFPWFFFPHTSRHMSPELPDISKITSFSPSPCMLSPSTGINELPASLPHIQFLSFNSTATPPPKWQRMTLPSHHTPVKNFPLKNSYFSYMTRPIFHLEIRWSARLTLFLPPLYRFSLPPSALAGATVPTSDCALESP